jgi:hypothetical protein
MTQAVHLPLLDDLMAGRFPARPPRRPRADRCTPDEFDTLCAACGRGVHDIPQGPDRELVHREAAVGHAVVPDRTPLDLRRRGLR